MAAISCCKTDYQELNFATRASIKNVLGTEVLTKDETIRQSKENVSVYDNKKCLNLIQRFLRNVTVGE